MNRSFAVVCFFEDVAHEKFVTALVQRAAQDLGISAQIDVRNASHGSRVWKELMDYLRDLRRGVERLPDVLVIVIDGDCKRSSQVRKEIHEMVQRSGLRLPPEYVICAVPEPHIERWYLEDQRALSTAIPGARSRKLRYKCERDRYKQALSEAIRASGVEPLLGGAEYGAEVAAEIEPDRLDRSFRKFWGDLLNAFRVLSRRP
ncbi:MAG: hypothetical protein DRG83_22110 [Deltaproteobacteria bacterium]|nr:MAG: hypothetical protein DRG83_22110 [Deltaproteobacteria bacterium]